jgi:hypothetical protein
MQRQILTDQVRVLSSTAVKTVLKRRAKPGVSLFSTGFELVPPICQIEST